MFSKPSEAAASYISFVITHSMIFGITFPGRRSSEKDSPAQKL